MLLPLRARSATPIRVGYQATLASAVDIIAIEEKLFDRAGVSIVASKFDAGRGVRDAIVAGAIDIGAMCLAAILASYQIGAAILPANAPNLAIAGTSEMMYGTVLTYGEYLGLQFPVMGFVKGALIVAMTCWMFPAEVKGLAGGSATKPMSTEEKRLAGILLAALVMWATDFLHRIHPGWIGLVAGVLCILPRVGVLPAAAFNDRIKYGPYFYIGSVLGLGAVIIDTGLARALGGAVLPMSSVRSIPLV